MHKTLTLAFLAALATSAWASPTSQDYSAALRACPQPNFPASVRREGRDGIVTVRYLLNEQGKVIDAQIASSSGEQALDAAALDAGRACKFPPAERNGYAVQIWLPVSYVFVLAPKLEYLSSLIDAAKKGEPAAAGKLAVMRLKFPETIPGWSEQDARAVLFEVAGSDPEAAFELGRFEQRRNRRESAIDAYRAAAELGNPKAGYELGLIYSMAPLTDSVQAFQWFLEGAKAGDAAAQRMAADAYLRGSGVQQDLDQAVRWATAAAAQGDAQAMLVLAQRYYNRNAGAYNLEQAVAYFRQAADKGETSAQYAMGVFHSTGEGTARDQALAIKYWRQAAELGNMNAQYSLALALQPSDTAGSERWMLQSARMGYAPAQIHIATRIRYLPPEPKRDAEMLEWFRRAAAAGDGVAMQNVGHCYHTGRGVAVDLNEAKRWYEQSAAKGEMIGYVSLGALAEAAKDYGQALKHYNAAAGQGDAQAQFHLALLLEGGMGKQPDTARAFAAYMQSARKGFPDAMRRLVRVYESGELGQKADAAQAKEWQGKLTARQAP